MTGIQGSGFPESRTILFVGGAEDGRVIQGQEAWFMTVTIGKEQNPNGSYSVSEAPIGSRFKVTSSRLFQAMQLLGMQEAFAFFNRYGVASGNQTGNIYELAEKLDGLYVFRFVSELTKQESSAVSAKPEKQAD